MGEGVLRASSECISGSEGVTDTAIEQKAITDNLELFRECSL